MSFDIALKSFQHTVDHEPRVSAAINRGLLAMADRDRIEACSLEVSNALALGQRVWMSSDLHFLHTDIITYSNRPFRDVKDMTAAHLRQLQKIPQEDLVLLVGDMSLSADYERGVDLMRMIPGRKILVAGNHDLLKTGECTLAREKELLEAVVPFLTWTGTQNTLVLVSHYPAELPTGLKHRRVINYHGHMHQHPCPSTEYIKRINVGWDVSHALICL